MTQLIRLDKAHTDLAAPRIAHGIGVAGATRRYIPEYLNQAVGTTVTRQPDEISAFHLTNGAATIQLREADGIKFLHSTGTATLNSLAPDTAGPLTFAVVARRPVSGAGTAVAVGGYGLGRAANGQWQVTSRSGGSQLLASTNDWGVWIVSADGANSAISANGVETPAPTLVTPDLNGYKFTSIGAGGGNLVIDNSVAELTIWPFATTAAQRASIRAAMKAKYPMLP